MSKTIRGILRFIPNAWQDRRFIFRVEISLVNRHNLRLAWFRSVNPEGHKKAIDDLIAWSLDPSNELDRSGW